MLLDALIFMINKLQYQFYTTPKLLLYNFTFLEV